jgi:uncharacterized protein YxjI
MHDGRIEWIACETIASEQEEHMLRRNRRRAVATGVVAGAAIGAAGAAAAQPAPAPVAAAAAAGVAPAAAATRGNRYRMVEKIAAIGDDFFIQNDRGQRAFKVNGKALRARDTLFFEDMQGHRLCKIQSRVARVRESMEIEGPEGGRLAIVHKAMITPLRDRFVVNIGNGPDLEVQGNILDHEYRIGHVATISRKWFRVRDSYGVEIAPGQNDVLILAVTVVIDQMTHDVG